MRRSIPAFVLLAVISTVLGSCSVGTNNNSGGTPTPTTSGLNNRVFVSNACVPSGLGGCSGFGALNMIDANNDNLTQNSIGVGPQPGLMAVSALNAGHRATTLVFNTGDNSISVISNSAEIAVPGSPIKLRGATESMAVSPDGLKGYAAVPGALPIGGTDTGLVVVMNLATPSVTAELAIPQARFLALSPDGTKLLVLSDQVDTVTLINTADNSTAATFTSPDGVDRPVAALFTSDGSTAYILNCGAECGGGTATVAVLNMAGPSITTTINVDAAHVGLIDTAKKQLYVAGNSNGGKLDVLNINTPDSPSVTLGLGSSPFVPAVTISDGVHTLMALGSNNKLFIGARNSASSNCVLSGCLTFFDTNTNTTSVDNPIDSITDAFKGEVTGMQPLLSRGLVYVVEGNVSGGPNVSSGELRVFDTASNPPSEIPGRIDIRGQAVDVKAVDQ